jgi:D-inositol-3-phosphate glycosyltransferase
MSAAFPANISRQTADQHARESAKPAVKREIAVGLLTGGIDSPYVFGLAMALASKGVRLDVIGSDAVDRPELHAPPKLNFLNLRGDRQPQASLRTKVARVLVYYSRLIRYAAIAKPRVFHILWNNKFQFFDRTLLMIYYKLLRRKIVLTAHNVNAGKRDSNDSLLNRLTLRIQYRLADRIFVHTKKMKTELLEDFGVPEQDVTVIPFGINNAVPDTNLTPAEAKERLGIQQGEKTILFFGSIRRYKGLDYLVKALERITTSQSAYRLVIAGEPMKESEDYPNEIRRMVNREGNRERVISRLEFIPDDETELYFKAADVVALPYAHIYQSGVLFLAYRFGVPVIATDVGNFRQDIVEGRTGFLCRPCDSLDLARAIETYFASELHKRISERRQEIRDYANDRNSWDVVGEMTFKVYVELLAGNESRNV